MKQRLKLAGKGPEDMPMPEEKVGGFDTMAQRNFMQKIGDSLLESPDSMSSNHDYFQYGDDDSGAFLLDRGGVAYCQDSSHHNMVGALHLDDVDADEMDYTEVSGRDPRDWFLSEEGSGDRGFLSPNKVRNDRGPIQGRLWIRDKRIAAVSFWDSWDRVKPHRNDFARLWSLESIRDAISDDGPDDQTWWEFSGKKVQGDPWRNDGSDHKEAPVADPSIQHVLPPGHRDKIKRDAPPPSTRHLGGFDTMAQRNYARVVGDSLILKLADRILEDFEETVYIHLLDFRGSSNGSHGGGGGGEFPAGNPIHNGYPELFVRENFLPHLAGKPTFIVPQTIGGSYHEQWFNVGVYVAFPEEELNELNATFSPDEVYGKSSLSNVEENPRYHKGYNTQNIGPFEDVEGVLDSILQYGSAKGNYTYKARELYSGDDWWKKEIDKAKTAFSPTGSRRPIDGD